MENSFGTDRQKDIYLIPLQLKFFFGGGGWRVKIIDFSVFSMEDGGTLTQNSYKPSQDL